MLGDGRDSERSEGPEVVVPRENHLDSIWDLSNVPAGVLARGEKADSRKEKKKKG